MKAWLSLLSVVVIATWARAQTEVPAAIVVRPPAEVTVIAGQTVRLTCVAYGYPVPSVTWTASSQDLDLTDKVTEETVTVNGTTFQVSVLQLCDITSANAAEYTCAASNDASGTAIASNSAKSLLTVSLPVTVPPAVVVRPPEMNTVDVDETVEMICVAYGNPIPMVTWSRPGCSDLNDTSESINIKIYSEMVTYNNTTFQKSVMQICAIKPEDSNHYACTAKNGVSGMGLARPEASFQIRVNGGETSRIPTPTETVLIADASSSIPFTLATLLIIVEGVIILILFAALLIVSVWVVRLKKTSLISKNPADTEIKPEKDEGDSNLYDEIHEKALPISSTNPVYQSTLPP